MNYIELFCSYEEKCNNELSIDCAITNCFFCKQKEN